MGCADTRPGRHGSPHRSLLCEDEGDDEANAFCQANYGIGDLQGANGKLAFAYMDLTFKPHTFPGLDGTKY